MKMALAFKMFVKLIIRKEAEVKIALKHATLTKHNAEVQQQGAF